MTEQELTQLEDIIFVKQLKTKKMVLTSEQVVERLAKQLKTNVKTLIVAYYTNQDFKEEIDNWLQPINDRREKNGHDRVILSKEYYDKITQMLLED